MPCRSSPTLAKTIRSKNAGVDLDHVRHHLPRPRDVRAGQARARAHARDGAQALRHCRPSASRISSSSIRRNAIKFTIYRLRPSGSPGDPDIFGAQQYAPLLDIEVPVE